MPAWDDERNKPHVRSAAAEIRDTFKLNNIGGFATSGHIPGSYHYSGRALDIMTSVLGQLVANWSVDNAARLGIIEVIWNRRIWTPGKGWQPYSGSSAHTDHVHLSFTDAGGNETSNIGGTQNLSGNPGCLGWLTSRMSGSTRNS